MNWKILGTGVFCLFAGFSVAPFAHRTVSGATASPSNPHFQMESAIVDESNGQAQEVPTHEVFLLDTESGKVWKFQGLQWGQDKDGTTKIFAEPTFIPVGVSPTK